ncbi:MAG: prenyltransferase/squalene oxidase repeat-containing protein [Chloroflexota bacterium]
MVDVIGAVQYIEQHGSDVHKAMARYAVGAAMSGAVLTALEPLQRPDGGWTGLDPDCPDDLSTISCTWMALQYLRWIGVDSTPLIDSTVTFLAAQQHPDGYWDEPDAIAQYNAPPHMQPGEAATRMWLAAAVARMLLETGHDTQVYFGPALTYLSEQWEAGTLRGKNARLHPLWMMLPLFKMVGHARDAHIVESCNNRLLAAVEFEELDPMDVTAVAHAAMATRFAGNRLYIAARDYVLTQQQGDGGFTTHYGDRRRPNATVDALMLMRWGGLI